MGTQKTKLDFLERQLEKQIGYVAPKRTLLVGYDIILHLWQVAKMLEVMRIEGWTTDVSWIEDARPNQEELLEMAMAANMVDNVEILWGEIE